MARNRKPTALKEITGGFIAHPERRNSNEPTPLKGIGAAPASVSTDWRACWDEIVDSVCPGVLGNSDRLWLERAARLLAKSRADEEEFTGANEAALQTYLAKMGMSPADRSKLTVLPRDDEDPADKYF